jgi:TRAP-type mannitol/chloroaromatic compound transport system substrate-binding protein
MKRNSISRRKFLKTGTVAAGAAATVAVSAPAVVGQAAITLKMQSSWPASDIFQDMAKQYVERVEAMAGGRLKIDLLPAGAVVGAFQVQDACHDGVLDAAHTVPVYWYGKNKAASLFGTGPVFGADANQMIAWLHNGGGYELYRELTQDILGLNVVGFLSFGMPAQPFGWFKNEIKSADDVKGLKYRTVGLAADLFQAMGASVAQLPGGEIVPAMERGVIDAFEFNNPTSDMRFGSQDVAKHYYLASYHQASESFEYIFNKDKFESLAPDLQAILKHGVEAAHLANFSLAMDQYSADLQKLQNEHGVKVHRTADSILASQLDAWDKILPPLLADPYFKKVVDSQKAWVERVVYYTINNAPDYKLAYQHYYPGKL